MPPPEVDREAASTSPTDFERALAFDDGPVGIEDASFGNEEKEEDEVIELV